LLVAHGAVAPGPHQEAQRAAAWVPRYVYVRSEGVVRLSDLLNQVISFAANRRPALRITSVYFGGCRGIHPGWNPGGED
jgi:hypothetical protein